MESINNDILKELKQLRIDVNIIKEKLDDEDSQLTKEEELLEESYESEKNNKTRDFLKTG